MTTINKRNGVVKSRFVDILWSADTWSVQYRYRLWLTGVVQPAIAMCLAI